jgi:hypothetical protein
MTTDQELISHMQASEKAHSGNFVELPSRPPVTPSAREHEVPHSVHMTPQLCGFQPMGKEMVDIRGIYTVDVNIGKAIEAMTLLITV